MEESLSSGLPSGWEQGAPVAGWGAANIPAGYGTVQPPPGYPLIQQHPHSPYGAADLTSRYGAASSPIPYGTTDPAAAYRVLPPGPIGYDAVNLHSRYGLIDSSQDYRRAIPHSLYDDKGHNSGYSTPDHAVGYSHPEYEKSEASSVYGRSNPSLHYEAAGSHSPYHRSEPTSDFTRTDPTRGYDRRERSEPTSDFSRSDPARGYDRRERSEPTSDFARSDPARGYDRRERSEPASEFARTDPARGYERRETHPEYEKTEPQPRYERVEPSRYSSSDPLSRHATADSHAGYEKSVPTTEYDGTERARVYDSVVSHSGYMNTEHPEEFERSEHRSGYEKTEHLSEYDRTENPSEKNKTEYSSEFEKTESSEYSKTKETEHPSEHPSENPSEHDITDSTKEKDTEQPASEYEGAVSHSAFETSASSSVWGAEDSTPAWSKPDLPPGWERKFIERQNEANGEKSVDMYYISPTGKKLESKPEVINYCQEEGFDVDLKLFTFTSSNTQSPVRPSEYDPTEHTSENDKTEQSTENGKTEHTSENDKTEHSSEKDKAEHTSENDKTEHSSENDKTKHLSENDKTEHIPEFKETESLVTVKTEKPDDPTEHDITHPTAEKDTEDPASEHEVGVSHSIFESGDSSSAWGTEDSSPAWAKTDLPPGWERKIIERQNGVSGARKRVDIYYISPTGKKLRSKPDVVKYCQEEGIDVDLQLFGFSLKKIGSPAMPSSPAPPGEAPKTTSGRGRPRGRGKPKSASLKKGRNRNEQEIEKILDHREASGGDTMYHVKWFGYNDSYNTWENLSSLGPDAADLIEHYWAHKEAQSQINQDILQSIMQIHSNGAEKPNDNVEPEEHTEIPSYFPQHFLSSSFYEESEPVKAKGKSTGKARRGRPRGSGRVSYFPQHFLCTSFSEELEPTKIQNKGGRSRGRGRGGSSPVVKPTSESGRGRPKGRPRKHPPSYAADSTEGAATSDPMNEDHGSMDTEFSAALQCETVMQEGSQENPSVSQETIGSDSKNESAKPVEQQEKKDPPETVLVPELAGKPRCLVLDRVPNKNHEKEIDVIVSHQTKGVKETKYFVRYFPTLEKEAKPKGHSWIFESELKDCKEILESYWAKRNAKVNNVVQPAVTKPLVTPASKKSVEIIDLSDDEGDGKKNMAKPSQPLGQQRKQQVSSMSSWHTPVIDESTSTPQQEEYQVERIMLHRKRNGKTQYLVKWKDYPQSEATWEPEENLKSCKTILDAYHKRKIEKVVFHRDLSGKREYLIKWEGFFSRHNSWETSETCSHLRDFQTHVNEYWRRKQEEADRKKRNLEECQQYYNTVKERENREKRPRVDSAADANKEWVIDSLCKTRDDDMEPSFLIKLCLLNTAINSLRCDRCGQQTLKFNKSGESLLSDLTIKCQVCPDIRTFSTSKPSTNEPFLDIGGGEYIPLEINSEAQPVIVPVPVPIKKLTEAKSTSGDTKTENTLSENTKTAAMEVDKNDTTEMKTDIKTEVDENEKKEIEMEAEQDATSVSGNATSKRKEPASSSSDVTTKDNVSSEMAAALRSTSTTALTNSATQLSTTNIENSNVQQDKVSGCESNLQTSTTENKDARNPESINSSQDNLIKETCETASPAPGASESTAKVQSMDDDDDDDIIMTEPEDPLCL